MLPVRGAGVGRSETGTDQTMRSISLGRIRAIDIRLHPSFALVLLWVLIDWNRLVGVAGGSVAFGLVFVCLVFACVLLHELGHAFMAMHYGIRVHDVTLSAIGGVARFGRMPIDPRAEAAIALAGPVVNVALAVLLAPWVLFLGVLAGYTTAGEFLRELLRPTAVGLVAGLVAANLMLAVFNLLPAFPMDGGRLLRAALASGIGRDNGTRTAVLVAQGLAAAMAVAGVVWLGSISLPSIALFIAVMAHAEGRSVRIEGALRRLRVGQFALWDRGGVAPDQPLTWALRGGPRDVAVTDNGRVVGMLWRNRLLAEIGTGAGGRLVADVMDTEVPAVAADASVYDVHLLMSELDHWALPVTEDGAYRGVFTVDRLAHVYRQVTPSGRAGGRFPLLDGALDGLLRALAR